MHLNYQKQFTALKINKHPKIDLNHSIGFIGSCFAQNMGMKLDDLGYTQFQSPFGVVFNPISIVQILKSLKKEEEPWGSVDDEFFSFNHHHKLRHTSFEALKSKVKSEKILFLNQLKSAKHLFVSLGSAWCYRHIKEDIIVANCHKLPQKKFNKVLLSESEVSQALKDMTNELLQINADLQIYFTISPVKHLRDGVVENSQSKARIISALQAFLQENIEFLYFPAFEILQEELRDYRYYSDDLAHPSEWAKEYIFNRWVETYFTEENNQNLKGLIAKKKRLEHRQSKG
ncbi:GSCFA domain-containing protein [Bacteroidia bacterium]|nr:GSCFA domain-containing protein [Bacteroidia bacterium]